MKTDTRSLVKLIGGYIVGAGATAITTGFCSSLIGNIPNLKKPQKILCSIGGIVLGMMAGDAADKYFCGMMDESYAFIDAVNAAKQERE